MYSADVRARSAELDGPVDAQVVRGDDGLAADRVHPGDHPLQRRGLFDRDAVDALLQQLSDPEAVLGHDLYAGADAVHEDLDALLRARYTQADRRRGRFVAADLRPIADQSAEFRRLRLVGVRQRDRLLIPEAGLVGCAAGGAHPARQRQAALPHRLGGQLPGGSGAVEQVQVSLARLEPHPHGFSASISTDAHSPVHAS